MAAFTQPVTIVTLVAFVMGVPVALYLAVGRRRNWVSLIALLALLAVVMATLRRPTFLDTASPLAAAGSRIWRW